MNTRKVFLVLELAEPGKEDGFRKVTAVFSRQPNYPGARAVFELTLGRGDIIHEIKSPSVPNSGLLPFVFVAEGRQVQVGDKFDAMYVLGLK
jgi:hypothetical protein